MKPRHQVSRTAIELIKRFEGYRRKAAQLPDGRWTIGYGHTLTARQGAEVSEEDAEALLLYDLIAVAHVVNEQAYAPLSQNQFDALCAFAFNIGLDNFRRSAVLKRLNEGAAIQAAFAMELWRKAEFEGERIVVDALVRRRAAEKLLFLTPPGGAWTIAPSPILKPVLDLDGFDTTPRQTPTPMATTLDGERVLVVREDRPTAALAEPEPSEAENPMKAVAEQVSARLQTIFPETGEPTEVGPSPEPVAEEPRPQADFAPPITVGEPPGPAPEPAFELTAPVEELDETPAEQQAESRGEPVAEEATGPDLFDPPTAANDAREAEAAAEPPAETSGRVVIDDTVPYDFIAPTVQPLPQQPKDGLLTLVSLAVLGLAFFGGGIFWVVNAQPRADGMMLDARWVGGLASVAGVAFFCVAIYLLLRRLGRAAERRTDNPRI
ncbi:lysozyme [Phenylobacterium hankyongense]|uniref:Lysozyme n=1 Tax=Phenylobacterium hankyongense TaxID=1813876 RepID=A0A328B6S8_9CAUL|nr:glycoside hydrolase family protein [Phenylobacterium hankyongense]RAK61564.1 lysozyme [Phenylobacterium hankyongense]